MSSPATPKAITTWTDLTKLDVRLVNRERGSGARVLLDEKLRQLDIDPYFIQGYNNEEMSHLAVASQVARGAADVGLGVEKAATQMRNVDFIPLQKERYDLVLLRRDLAKPHFQALLAALASSSFREEVSGMAAMTSAAWANRLPRFDGRFRNVTKSVRTRATMMLTAPVPLTNAAFFAMVFNK